MSAVDDKQFQVIGVVVAATLFGALFYLRFCGARELPPVPPEPVFTEQRIDNAQRSLSASPEVYTRTLAEDSAKVGGEVVTPNDLGVVLKHSADRTGRTLAPGERVQTVGLELAVSVQEIDATRRQMVLRISNLTDDYLAYRVVTEPSRGTAPCGRKETLPHNASALTPGSSVMRSECIYRDGWKLDIVEVETIAVPHLSYHYISSVPPTQIGKDLRIARGHEPPTKLPACTDLILPIKIKRARERGEVSWRDLVDFFARHSCEHYQFPENYRAFERPNQRPLPIEGSLR